jgi:hypothetical protein
MLAALAALFAVATNGREPDVEGFRAYAASGYTIISREEDTARRIPTQIAMIDAVLAKVLNRGARAEIAPTFVFVVPQRLWTNYLRPAIGVDEEFVAGRFVNYLLINKSACSACAWRREIVRIP